jgi:hypothetical protein
MEKKIKDCKKRKRETIVREQIPVKGIKGTKRALKYKLVGIARKNCNRNRIDESYQEEAEHLAF